MHASARERLPYLTDPFGARLAGAFVDVELEQTPAGTDWSYLLPGGGVWRLALASANLLVQTGIENKQIGFQIKDDQARLRFLGATPCGTSNAVRKVAYAPGFNPLPAGEYGFPTVVTPMAFLPPGWTIGSFTSGAGATFRYNKILLVLENLWDVGAGEAPGHPPLEVPHWSDVGLAHAT